MKAFLLGGLYMKADRNNQMPPMMPFGNIPVNMMMMPNYMNDNYNNLENKVNSLEKKVRVLENRISRLEAPYQNNMQNCGQNQNNMPNQLPYQTTQNNGTFNGEMYMM